MTTTVNWTGKDLLTSTSYGELWLVTEIDDIMTCHLVRSKKGTLFISKEKKTFMNMYDVNVGDLLHEDKGLRGDSNSRGVHRLIPDPALQKNIDKAIAALKPKKMTNADCKKLLANTIRDMYKPSVKSGAGAWLLQY